MLFLKGLTISILVLSSQALRAVPFGPCASLCGNTSDTTSDEIVCSDTDYQGTAAGQTAQACISCQLNSTAVDTATNTSDLQWALCRYHLAEGNILADRMARQHPLHCVLLPLGFS